MHLNNLPLGITDWSQVAASSHPGETGIATMRARQLGDFQLRLVEYSPRYVSDHWCHKGHIVFVVAGRLVIEHQDGAAYVLAPGTSYHVPDGAGASHRVLSIEGAVVFIVD